MIHAVGRLRTPPPLTPRRPIPTLMLLAEEVHFGHDARNAAHCLTLVCLAKRTPGDAPPLTARVPNTGMLPTILPPQPNSAVAPRRSTGMVVAGATVALDLSHAGASAVVAADVVAAGHGARIDDLVAGDAAGPAARVLAAVGALVAAGVGAGVGLADVFLAGIASGWISKALWLAVMTHFHQVLGYGYGGWRIWRRTSLWGPDALLAPDAPGVLASMNIAKGARVEPRLRARYQVAGVARAIPAPLGLWPRTSSPLADVPRTQRAVPGTVDAIAAGDWTPDERQVLGNEGSHRGDGRGIIVIVSRIAVSRGVRLFGRRRMTVRKTPTLSWVRTGSGHGYVVIWRRGRMIVWRVVMRGVRRTGWETRGDWSPEGLCWVVVQALVLVSGTFGSVAVRAGRWVVS